MQLNTLQFVSKNYKITKYQGTVLYVHARKTGTLPVKLLISVIALKLGP